MAEALGLLAAVPWLPHWSGQDPSVAAFGSHALATIDEAGAPTAAEGFVCHARIHDL